MAEVDTAQALDFLKRITKFDAITEARCIHPDGRIEHRWGNHDDYSTLIEELAHLNNEGFSIYYSAMPRSKRGGTKIVDCAASHILVCDMDGNATPEKLVAAIVDVAKLPHPHYVISTGGGAQAVWVLSSPLDPDEWRAKQKAIISRVIGCDTAIHDPARVMRWPPFINRKEKYADNPPVAFIAIENPGICCPDDFPDDAGVKVDPEIADRKPVAATKTGDITLLKDRDREFLASGKLIVLKDGTVKGRRDSAFLVAKNLAAAGIPLDDAQAMIRSALEKATNTAGETLTPAQIDEVISRQVRNAYKGDPELDINPDRLPVTTGTKNFTAEVHATEKAGVHKFVIRRGLSVHTDVINASKTSARKRFLKDATDSLGDDLDVAAVGEFLKAAAVGDVDLEGGDDLPEGSGEITASDCVDVSRIIRPELFAIQSGDEWKAGITVPIFRDVGESDLAGTNLVVLNDNEGHRNAIELPGQFVCGGDVFHVHPKLPAPGVKSESFTWSKAAMWHWIDTGETPIPARDLVPTITTMFDRFVFISESMREGYFTAMAMFAISTYLVHRFTVVPYMTVNGPRGSGKGRVVNCLKQIVFRPYVLSNPSAASLYRHVHMNAGTVLMDEAEGLADLDPASGLTSTLLCSNTRGFPIPRCDGDDNQVVEFDAFSPKVFVSIEQPLDTLLDRSIVIPMFRAKKGDPRGMVHPGSERFYKEWQRLRDALHALVLNHAGDFLNMPPAHDVTPANMMPRAREVWSVPLQVAVVMDRIGGTGYHQILVDLIDATCPQSEVSAVKESDELILRAFWRLLKAGKETSSGAVLRQAYVEGLDAHLGVSAKAVTATLKSYQMKPGTGRRSRWFTATPDHMANIVSNYGVDLHDPELVDQKDTATTPENHEHHGHHVHEQPDTKNKYLEGYVRDVRDVRDSEGYTPPKKSDTNSDSTNSGEVEL